MSQLKTTVSLYFPDLSSQELLSLEVFQAHQDTLSVLPLVKSWQEPLCDQLKVPQIPWDQLRAFMLDIAKEVKTVVCCDPVMMQMTHRGAYLWGQQLLTFSEQEQHKIIQQINLKLMEEGECFYFVNQGQWLYTNQKAIPLDQPSFEEYIGKDMFGFSYSGKEGRYWDRLATEIQMLIKQMMDYQGLTAPSPEMIVNVHFWGNSHSRTIDEARLTSETETTVYSADKLLKIFCQKIGVKFEELSNHGVIFLPPAERKPKDAMVKDNTGAKNNILIISKNDDVDLNQLVSDYIHKAKIGDITLRLITQDKLIELQSKRTWLQRVSARLTGLMSN